MAQEQNSYPLGSLLPAGQPIPRQMPRQAGYASRGSRSRSAAYSFADEAGTEIGRGVMNFLARLRDGAPRARSFAMGWLERIRSFWRRGTTPARLWSILHVVGGIAMLVVLAYAAVILIPILIGAAFIAAILVAIGQRR